MRSKSAGGAACGIVLALCSITSAKVNADTVVLDLGEGATMEVVKVLPGRFQQGSPLGEPGRATDEIQREVSLTTGFLIGKTPVTLAQWRRFVAATGFRSEAEKGASGGFGWDGSGMVQGKAFTWRNPGFPQSPDDPVCIITFEDARAFCGWLARITDRAVTLPTEAQWEYACRAETTTAWHSGGTADDSQSGFWHKENSGNSTHPVATMARNRWGIHIGGNVAEWCLDWHAPYQAEAQVDPLQSNPKLSDKPRRVLRGGSWNRDAKNTRSAARWRADPGSRNADTGFRVLCSIDKSAGKAAASPAESSYLVESSDPSPLAPSQPGSNRSESVETSPSSPPVRSTGISGMLTGLLCLLIPLGLLIWMIRLIAGREKSSPNPFVTTGKLPPSLPRTRSGIRKTEDGFWIDGDWPLGTRLMVNYVVDGVGHNQELIYQPGPGGQFIYTGGSPQSVSTVTAEGSESPSSLPPPLIPDPSWGSEDRRDRGDDTFHGGGGAGQASSPPPIFPSAY